MVPHHFSHCCHCDFWCTYCYQENPWCHGQFHIEYRAIYLHLFQMLLYSLYLILHSFFSIYFLFSLNVCSFFRLFFRRLLPYSKPSLCCREYFQYHYYLDPLICFYLLIFTKITKFVISSALLRFHSFSFQLLQQPQIFSFRYAFLTQQLFYLNQFDQIWYLIFFPIRKLVPIYYQQLRFSIVPH